jgi:predicted Fe-Mo cluster-binding NifX family protein
MKIAVTAQKNSPEGNIDTRFGRAEWFMVYDEEQDSWEAIENTQNMQAVQGAGIQSAANVVNAGCGVLISGHCGPKAFNALSKASVEVYAVNGGTVKQAVDAYFGGILARLEKADVEGHW